MKRVPPSLSEIILVIAPVVPEIWLEPEPTSEKASLSPSPSVLVKPLADIEAVAVPDTEEPLILIERDIEPVSLIWKVGSSPSPRSGRFAE
jgi:hypothetical protein